MAYMKRYLWLILLCALLAVIVGAVSLLKHKAAFVVEKCVLVDRLPHIRPDYTETVIPPNIAPLNFLVEEPGTHYRVRMYSTRSKDISILSRSAKIVIPPKPWKELLAANRGEELRWDVYVRKPDGHWSRFETITTTIASEDIDGYLVYRLIKPAYNYWTDMGIYQRNIANYDESGILYDRQFPSSSPPCINCHTFLNNRTDRMTLGIRSQPYGSCALIGQGSIATKLDTKFGYNSWHPSGRLVAYTLMDVHQFFHPAGVEVRDVVDLDSDLAYYEVGSQTVKTTTGISDPNRLETYPTWSPDGRHLYFCSAPILWSDRETIPPEGYEKVRYDLRRIRYNIETDTWGEPETVLAASETGLCIMLPRVSPDGRFLLFCMCEYGCFPIYQPSSDLYLMDLETGEYRRLEINSDRSESWHSWSSNSRWFAFSSKRRDGLFTRTYLSYLDETGKAHKPVLLPQKDPTFYDSFLKTYTVPELIVEPVQVSSMALANAVRSSEKIEVELPAISMTRKTKKPSPWRSGSPKLPRPKVRSNN